MIRGIKAPTKEEILEWKNDINRGGFQKMTDAWHRLLRILVHSDIRPSFTFPHAPMMVTALAESDPLTPSVPTPVDDDEPAMYDFSDREKDTVVHFFGQPLRTANPLKVGLEEFQREVGEWSMYNFPNETSDHLILGAMEEIGELSHAHLKTEQGIRGTAEEHKAEKKDAVGDCIVFLTNYCRKNGISIYDAIFDTWREVRKRDWRKFPKNGRTE